MDVVAGGAHKRYAVANGESCFDEGSKEISLETYNSHSKSMKIMTHTIIIS